VFPGDIILGDDHGVIVIPAHLSDDIAEETFEMKSGQLIALLARRRDLFMCLSCMLYMLASPGCPSQELPLPADASAHLFNNACQTCHTIREGDNRFGPTLYNIIGRKAASLPNYNYSSAMKDADFEWEEEKLDRFIADPDEVMPNNNMRPYGGLASADDRAKIIAFLRSMTTRRL
jgi:cytochrome c